MTAQRREINGARRGIALILVPASLFLLPPALSNAATTERVVIDRYTGLAIGGFDPVGYFTNGRATPGLPGLEFSEAGAIWRFQNEGNRIVFAAHPDVYGPQFGGYDPVDVARGVPYAGDPRFWLVRDNRLYLFGRAESRDAFDAASADVIHEAEKRWPAVEALLAR